MKILNFDGLVKVINNIKSGFAPNTRTINGKTLEADITLSASDVNADASGSAAASLTLAKAHTDTSIATVNTNIDELSSELTEHKADTTSHITAAERTQWNAAEPNQNAFSSIVVNQGDSLNSPNSNSSLGFKQGTGIQLSYTVGKDSDVDIKIENTGVKSVSTGRSNGTISVDGTDVAIKGLGTAAYVDMDNIQAKIDAKADSTHSHDSSEIVFESSTKEVAGSTVQEALENADFVITNMITTIDGKADSTHTHSYNLADIADTNAPWEVLSGSDAEDLLLSADSEIASLKTNKADASNLTSHTGNSTIHVTQADKDTWNAKVNADHNHTLSNITDYVVDSSLSTTSTNPVENQAVTNWLSDNVKNYRLAISNAGSSTSGYAYLTSDEVDVVASAPTGNNVIYSLEGSNDTAYFGVLWENIYDIPSASTSSGEGIVALTDSISSTSTSTAATPNSVKQAYDLANTANTNIDTLSAEVIRVTDEGSVPIADDSIEIINQIPISTDDDGNIYNGVGYKESIRWSASSKAETTITGMCMSGYIPCNPGDELRLKNVTITGASSSYIVLYDANKTYLSVISVGSETTADENGVYYIQITGSTAIKYLRLSIGSITSESIATVNQDFTLTGTAQTGWLTNESGGKISPRILASQVIRTDGTSFSNYIDNVISEVETSIATNTDAINVLETDISNKAESSTLTSHTSNTSVHITDTERTNWDTAYEYSKKNHASSSFTTVSYDDLSDAYVSASSPYDTLSIRGQNGIEITGDSGSKYLYIKNSGVRSISTGSVNGTINVDTGGTSTDVTVKGLGSAAYTDSSAYAESTHTHTASEIGADTSGSAAQALTDAKAYVDSQISNLSTGTVVKIVRW